MPDDRNVVDICFNAVDIGHTDEVANRTEAESRGDKARVAHNAQIVFEHLEALHASLEAGASFPSYRQIMAQFQVSERVVARALGELERRGKIMRSAGRAGSRVCHPPAQGSSPVGAPAESFSAPDGTTSGGASLPRIVTLSQRDVGVFDRALQILIGNPVAESYALTCRLLDSDSPDRFRIPPEVEFPGRFLVFGRRHAPLARRLLSQGHRVVLLGSPDVGEQLGVPNVFSDHAEGARQVVQHLLQWGHRRIVLEGPGWTQGNPRYEGLLKAIRLSNASVHLEVVVEEKAAVWRSNFRLASEYFRQPESPTAVICWNDQGAVSMLTLLQRAGIQVPETVSLTGYDNLPAARSVTPTLTSVDISLELMVTKALDLLLREEIPSPDSSILLVPTLVAGASTGPARPSGRSASAH